METVSNVVRVHLPNYLKDLPVPNSFFGWFSLGVGDWIRLVPVGVTLGGLTYLSLQGLCQVPSIGPCLQDKLKKVPGFKPRVVNTCTKKDCPKVVDSVDIEDIGDKAVFCRCWKSAQFPYCDGSHNKHNDETGDNVGPLIVKKSS